MPALRTGEDMARDVREVFRMAGINVQTRYLGDGRVEIDGDVDQARFQEVLDSRAMGDVGVVDLVPGRRLTARAGTASASDAAAQPVVPETPVDIVSVVRGKEPYVVDSNGEQYPVGDTIPGHGKLTAIGSQIWVTSADGALKQIRPVTAAELAARAQGRGSDFANVNGGTASSAGVADDTAEKRAINEPGEKIDANAKPSRRE